MLKRIIVKLSGEALAEGADGIVNKDSAQRIVKDLLEIQKGTEGKTVDVSVVLGGGNIWRGRSADPQMDRVKADQMGMLATVINSIYLAEVVRYLGGKSIVLTPFQLGNMTEVYTKEKANMYFEYGYIVFFGAGLGHPYFSTDTIPVLRACELEADGLLFAKNIDGIYDKDPNVYADAKRFKEVSYSHIIENRLKALDLEAMVMCENNGLASYVFDLKAENSLVLAATGSEKFYEFGTKLII